MYQYMFQPYHHPVNFIKMEQWQRRVIKEHLTELVDLTSCNTELLIRLFSKEILTDEEIHEIVSCSKNIRHVLNIE